MKKISFGLGLLLGLTGSSIAATYYFADCQPGAAAGCVAGNNANHGTSPSAPKKDLTGVKLTAGDTYRFARGGAWANFQVHLYLPLSRKESPTIFEDYAPAWGANAPRPIFTSPSRGNAFRFENSGNSKHDEGYVIRNLELRGTGRTGKGIFVYNDADYITVENVVIDGFDIGVHVAGSNKLDPGSNGDSEYFVLRNSIIRNNPGQGFLGAGSYLSIENNEFDNNGFGQEIRNHNIYVSHVGANITIRGNRLTRNARFAGGPCSAVSLVSHGTHPNMLVENNYIYEDRVGSACFGIDLNSNSTGSDKAQDFTNLVVRGNTIVFDDPSQVAGTGIGCSTCPGAVIENNLIISQGARGSTFGINVPSSNVFYPERGDKPDTQASVRNNTIYIDAPGSGSVGVKLSAPASTGDLAVSNLIYFGPRAPARVRCFLYGARSAAAFKAADGNLCFRAGGSVQWSDQHPTLAQAQAAGFDRTSVAANPMFTSTPSLSNGFSLIIQAGSPAADRGHPSLSAPRDVTGQARDARPDIGAHEIRSGAGPTRAEPVRPRAPGGVTAR